MGAHVKGSIVVGEAPGEPLDGFAVLVGRDDAGWFVAEVEGYGDVPGTIIRDTDQGSLREAIARELERRMAQWKG